jgi:hypothetical protein
MDAVALLDKHCGDALGAIEGQIDLAEIDIAVNDDLFRRSGRPRQPIGDAAGDDDGGEGREENGAFHLFQPCRQRYARRPTKVKFKFEI